MALLVCLAAGTRSVEPRCRKLLRLNLVICSWSVKVSADAIRALELIHLNAGRLCIHHRISYRHHDPKTSTFSLFPRRPSDRKKCSISRCLNTIKDWYCDLRRTADPSALPSHLSSQRSAGSQWTGTAPCPAGRLPQRTSAALSAWPEGSGVLPALPQGPSVHAPRPAPLGKTKERKFVKLEVLKTRKTRRPWPFVYSTYLQLKYDLKRKPCTSSYLLNLLYISNYCSSMQSLDLT